MVKELGKEKASGAGFCQGPNIARFPSMPIKAGTALAFTNQYTLFKYKEKP